MPEGPAPAIRRRPADRRREILAAAIALAGERGMGNVTLADVAQAVGVTTPALYRHIGSKEELPAAVVAAVLDELADALEALGADAALPALVAALLDAAARDPAPIGAYLAIDPSSLAVASARADAARAAERRLLEPLAARTEAGDAVLRLRLRATLAAVHATTVRGAADSAVGRAAVAERLAAVLAGPQTPPEPAPAPPHPRRQLPEPVRSTLLHTAVRLFRARGYQAVGVDEIGAAAGISGPSLYRHFARKADLLIEASDRSTIAVLEALERILRTVGEPLAAAAALGDAYARIAVEHVDLIVVTAREAGNIPPDARGLHQQRRQSVTETWTDLLAPAQQQLTRRTVRALVAGGMAAARSAAVAGTDGETEATAAVAGEAARAIRLLTIPQGA